MTKLEAEKIVDYFKFQLNTIDEKTAGYHTVNFPHGYENYAHINEVERWVDEHCGWYIKMGRTYHFHNEQDATLFLMRWS